MLKTKRDEGTSHAEQEGEEYDMSRLLVLVVFMKPEPKPDKRRDKSADKRIKENRNAALQYQCDFAIEIHAIII
jgi:hypothetical protein